MFTILSKRIKEKAKGSKIGNKYVTLS